MEYPIHNLIYNKYNVHDPNGTTTREGRGTKQKKYIYIYKMKLLAMATPASTTSLVVATLVAGPSSAC